jgi:UDPglucose--hexose-1-phosphate uridylyltransferase
MPEFRRDPLSQKWFIYSPSRSKRPLNFRLVDEFEDKDPEKSPFKPGNEFTSSSELYALRPDGSAPNGPGWEVRVIPNRYPALQIEGSIDYQKGQLYEKMNGLGAHEVIIETPDPTKGFEELSVGQIVSVLDAYQKRQLDLMKDTRFECFSLFKNSGILAGASIKHEHSQLIAYPFVYECLKTKMNSAYRYFQDNGRNIFEEILAEEKRQEKRFIAKDDFMNAFCPYAPMTAFEVMLLPSRMSPYFHEASRQELESLAEMLKKTVYAYREGLKVNSFNFIIHSAPIRSTYPHEWLTSIPQIFSWHVTVLPRYGQFDGNAIGTGVTLNSVLPEDSAEFIRGMWSHA